MENSISKELLSQLVLLESEDQNKVLSYIKRLLNNEDLVDESQEMNNRAEASERDIAAGRVKSAEKFKQDFAQWQKKKRAAMKS